MHRGVAVERDPELAALVQLLPVAINAPVRTVVTAVPTPPIQSTFAMENQMPDFILVLRGWAAGHTTVSLERALPNVSFTSVCASAAPSITATRSSTTEGVRSIFSVKSILKVDSGIKSTGQPDKVNVCQLWGLRLVGGAIGFLKFISHHFQLLGWAARSGRGEAAAGGSGQTRWTWADLLRSSCGSVFCGASEAEGAGCVCLWKPDTGWRRRRI